MLKKFMDQCFYGIYYRVRIVRAGNGLHCCGFTYWKRRIFEIIVK